MSDQCVYRQSSFVLRSPFYDPSDASSEDSLWQRTTGYDVRVNDTAFSLRFRHKMLTVVRQANTVQRHPRESLAVRFLGQLLLQKGPDWGWIRTAAWMDCSAFGSCGQHQSPAYHADFLITNERALFQLKGSEGPVVVRIALSAFLLLIDRCCFDDPSSQLFDGFSKRAALARAGKTSELVDPLTCKTWSLIQRNQTPTLSVEHHPKKRIPAR